MGRPILSNPTPAEEQAVSIVSPFLSFTYSDEGRESGDPTFADRVIYRLWEKQGSAYTLLSSQTDIYAEGLATAAGPLWSPERIGTSLALWLDADMIAQADGSAVNTWSDLSNNGYHAVKHTSESAPILNYAGPNGKRMLQFDTDFLSAPIPAGRFINGLQATILFRKTGALHTNDQAVMSRISGAGTQNPLDRRDNLIRTGTGGTVQYTVPDDVGILTSWTILSTLVSPTMIAEWKNGSQTYQNLAPAFTTFTDGGTSINIGQRTVTSTVAFRGDVLTIVVTDPLTNLQRQKLEGYLAWRAGIQTSLHVSNIYRYEHPRADDGESPYIIQRQVWSPLTAGKKYAWTADVRASSHEPEDTVQLGMDTDALMPNGETDFEVTTSGRVTASDPLGKQYNIMPAKFSGTYSNATGAAATGAKVRLLKKNSYGEYSPYWQMTDANEVAMSVVNGSQVNVTWAQTKFLPLEWGADFAIEWQIRTASGLGEWMRDGYFSTNYPPGKGKIVSPESLYVSSNPLILFDLTDVDDDPGIAWFAPHVLPQPDWTHTLVAPSASYVDTDALGNVYVATSGGVRKLSPAGSLLSTFAAITNTSGGFRVVPTGDMISAATRTFYKYNAAGTLLGSVLLPGTVWTINGLTYDPGTSRWWMGFWENDPSPMFAIGQSSYGIGGPVLNFGSVGSGADQFNPPRQFVNTGISISPLHNLLYIGNGANPNVFMGMAVHEEVMIFDLDSGAYHNRFGTLGNGDGQILQIRDIRIHPTRGTVWIADYGKALLMEFSQFGQYLQSYNLPLLSGVETSPSRPVGMAFSPDGSKVYVTYHNANAYVRAYSLPTEASMAAASGLVADVQVATSYPITNAGFETGTTAGWTMGGTAGWTVTFGASALQVREGANSARVRVTGAPMSSGIGPYLEHTDLAMMPVVAGETYPVTYWVYNNHAQLAVTVSVMWYDSAGVLLKEDLFRQFATRDQWFTPLISATAPPHAVACSTRLQVERNDATYMNPWSGTGDVYIDGAEFGPGWKYARQGVHLGNGRFSYQTVNNDFQGEEISLFRVRGRDINNPGPWSEVKKIAKVAAPTATIVTPTPGQTFTTARPLFTWTTTTQRAWRIDITKADGSTAYTTGWVAEADRRSYQPPPGALADGVAYSFRFFLDDGKMTVEI